jgi:hypothetical protein
MRSECLRPILEPQHAGRLRVLDLEPGLGSSRPVRVLAVLRHDAFGAEPAGLGEDRGAVALEMVRVPDAGRRVGEEPGQPTLAHLERPGPPVLALDLQEVEGGSRRRRWPGYAACRRSPSLPVAPHRLAVDHGLDGPQGRHSLADARIAAGPVEAVACEKTHPALPLAGYEPIAVVLGNPLGADRRLCRSGRNARLDHTKPLRRPIAGTWELDTLVPAYATTIHKSQGSEYPAVIIPVLSQHYPMLQRNLLYTGITRGKRLVVLVGQRKAVAIAVRNISGRRRWSKLQEWLQSAPPRSMAG